MSLNTLIFSFIEQVPGQIYQKVVKYFQKYGNDKIFE